MKRRAELEPWMFGIEVEVDGQPVMGEVVRYTLMGRARMAIRRLLGRPQINGTPMEETPHADE